MATIHPFDGVENGVILEARPRPCWTNVCYWVGLLIVILCVVFVYICLALSTMQKAYPKLQTTYIQTMSVNVTKTQVALRVSFDVPSDIQAFPQPGTFVLSTRINKNLTLRAAADRIYNVSGQDQLLLLEFQIPTHLSVSESDIRSRYMKLEGDFKMNVKLAHYPFYPMAERHATFVCHVHFNNAPVDRVYHPICKVRSFS